MRTLKLHFPEDALPTLDIFLKQTKEARVFRRAQAVRDVVQGRRLQTVSDTLHFTYSGFVRDTCSCRAQHEHVHVKFEVMVSLSSRPRHNASFMAWNPT